MTEQIMLLNCQRRNILSLFDEDEDKNDDDDIDEHEDDEE
jgi:hypothetical protein